MIINYDNSSKFYKTDMPVTDIFIGGQATYFNKQSIAHNKNVQLSPITFVFIEVKWAWVFQAESSSSFFITSDFRADLVQAVGFQAEPKSSFLPSRVEPSFGSFHLYD